MLTAAYIRETILLMRKWDQEYAAAALERVKRNVPWLMKEPAPMAPTNDESATASR